MTAGRIRANVEYVNHKYADKSDNERLSLLFKAILADYAGYDEMMAKKLAEEQRIAHEKEVKDNIKKLSDIDWRKTNPEWENLVFVNGRVAANRSTQKAMSHYMREVLSETAGNDNG